MEGTQPCPLDTGMIQGQLEGSFPRKIRVGVGVVGGGDGTTTPHSHVGAWGGGLHERGWGGGGREGAA